MTQAAGGAGVGAGQRVPGPSRRRLLTVAAGVSAGLLVSGCKGIQSLGTPPPPRPDVRALQRAIAAERAMVARYVAAIAGLSGAGRALTALQAVHAEHVAHLSQLSGRLREPAASGGSPSPSATPSPSAPADQSQAAALAALERAEQAASDQLLGDLASLPPSLAQLFASIAASEATHVPYLHAAGAAR